MLEACIVQEAPLPEIPERAAPASQAEDGAPDGGEAEVNPETTAASAAEDPTALVRAYADRLRLFKCAADVDDTRDEWTPEEV